MKYSLTILSSLMKMHGSNKFVIDGSKGNDEDRTL